MKAYLAFLLALFASLLLGIGIFTTLTMVGLGTIYEGKGIDPRGQALALALATLASILFFAWAGRELGLRATPFRAFAAGLLPFAVVLVVFRLVPGTQSEVPTLLLLLVLMATVGYLPFRPRP